MKPFRLPDFRLPSGLKLPPRRYTAGFSAPDCSAPDTLILVGRATVSEGDTVTVGQPVALWQNTPVYTGLSGTVTDICNLAMEDGMLCPTVCIAADGEQTAAYIPPAAPQGRAAFVAAVRASGVFDGETPLWKTLQSGIPADTLLVNAVETEPYLAAVHRTLDDDLPAVLRGVQHIMEYLDIPRAVIAVGRDDRRAIQALRRECAAMSAPRRRLQVRTVAARYPYGYPAFLVRHLCGRCVPRHARPETVGVPVVGAQACAALAHYLATGIPSVSHLVTVDGSCIRHPQTLSVLHGTPFAHILAHCGGRTHASEQDRLILGGPISGRTAEEDNAPLRPHHTALLCFGADEACTLPEAPCIRCGRCAQVCLIRLNPCETEKALTAHDTALSARLHADACIHCGACSYICPSKRPLAAVMRDACAAIKREEERT